ncbi:MAG TPA: EF-P lysine aminoacylase EpmA [Verrucomicrobiae bacterium]|nr:EF-P lysine aminoacylase EpmA [Verrucomicrobiae bacterium]
MTTAAASRRRNLQARARIVGRIRRFFEERGYLETETPLRIPAPAPEAHIDAAPAGTWYLQTSPELCMKRLLAAGYDRIFQLSRCWREGERGRLHLPEFTMLEWYRGGDYTDLMEECRGLLRAAAEAAGTPGVMQVRGKPVSLEGDFQRLTVREAYRLHAGMSMEEALERDLFDLLMVERVEPELGVERPVFLCDYPASRAALARLKPGDPTVAERFELYVGGVELANAFSELADPVEQRLRFREERESRSARGMTPYPMPEPFLNELHLMPPSAGIALGVDRLVMLLTGAEIIDEVVTFTPEEL